MFLAGSAINSIKDARGEADPNIGAEAMQQAVDIHQSGQLQDVPIEQHVRSLAQIAERDGLTALSEALRQRYPEEAS